MSLSRALPAPLVAREWWCAPDEPLLWALWQEDLVYRVKGLDERGAQLESWGKRVARGGGKAAAAVGGFAGDALLTMAFGSGDSGDRGKPGSGGGRRADLTVFGSAPECAAVRTIGSTVPAEGSPYRTLWMLTPRRLGVAVELLARGGASARAGQGVRAGQGEFGKNAPGEPIRPERVLPWLEFGPNDIADCRPIGSKLPITCAITLRDGSGFGLNARRPGGVPVMLDALRAFTGGGGGRG
ncbi:hypothetical protein [Saccharopolyspora gregorii]|uniref:Uncharacterized protein n=1 Tax=Saccharopolyspora gregorii TaxID=33914 RepID=A0ABP6RSU5_9PSEU